MAKKKKLTLISKGLRYKLRVSVYLMAVIPLLVCVYLVSTYILPYLGFKLDVILTLGITVLVMAIGFFVIKEIFDGILSVSSTAKLIAAGQIDRAVVEQRGDEIGDLGQALNQLTGRIRDSMQELKTYSERTVEIDFDIQKRLLVLTTLLQVNTLISQGSRLEDILRMVVEKSRLLAYSDSAFLFLRQESGEFTVAAFEGNTESVPRLSIGADDSVFSGLINSAKFLVQDMERQLPRPLLDSLRERFGLENCLCLPVQLKAKVVGILGIGNNRSGFVYSKEDIDFLEILSKQLAIAVENDQLSSRVGKLEIKDDLTGLYNEAFIVERLEEEIQRAKIYQRPCAFILLNVDNFQKLRSTAGPLYAENALKKVSRIVRESVTEIDRVARTESNEFAIVLPERNKRQALYTAEEVRKKIEFAFSKEQDVERRLSISGGVSENPLDGVSAPELITKARSLLSAAKAQGKNRVYS